MGLVINCEVQVIAGVDFRLNYVVFLCLSAFFLICRKEYNRITSKLLPRSQDLSTVVLFLLHTVLLHCSACCRFVFLSTQVLQRSTRQPCTVYLAHRRRSRSSAQLLLSFLPLQPAYTITRLSRSLLTAGINGPSVMC